MYKILTLYAIAFTCVMYVKVLAIIQPVHFGWVISAIVAVIAAVIFGIWMFAEIIKDLK